MDILYKCLILYFILFHVVLFLNIGTKKKEKKIKTNADDEFKQHINEYVTYVESLLEAEPKISNHGTYMKIHIHLRKAIHELDKF